MLCAVTAIGNSVVGDFLVFLINVFHYVFYSSFAPFFMVKCNYAKVNWGLLSFFGDYFFRCTKKIQVEASLQK